MQERGVLHSIRYVKDANGLVDEEDRRITEVANEISKGLLLRAAVSHMWRPSIASRLLHGVLASRHRNGEGGRVGFLWQALNGLALGVEHRHAPAVVFHALFNEAAGTVAMFASLVSGRPWSVEVHAPLSLSVNPSLLAFKLNESDLVVAISEYMARAIHAIANPVRLEVVHCGIDLERFTFAGHRSESSSTRLISSVGSLIDKKGHDTLIAAASQLTNEFVLRTIIVGEGVRRPDLERLIDSTGAVVELVGQIDPHKVRDIVRRSDVFVLACRQTPTGDEDGIPVALMEAMALGVPVVSTRIAGIPELLAEGSVGELCPPDDPEAVANGIRRVLSDEAIRSRLAKSARQQIENHFANDRETGRLIALIETLNTPR